MYIYICQNIYLFQYFRCYIYRRNVTLSGWGVGGGGELCKAKTRDTETAKKNPKKNPKKITNGIKWEQRGGGLVGLPGFFLYMGGYSGVLFGESECFLSAG
jgi:hypothetical protein